MLLDRRRWQDRDCLLRIDVSVLRGALVGPVKPPVHFVIVSE